MFISYATEYDHYKGDINIGALPVAAQDDLIRAIFDPEKDFRTLVVSLNVRKAQAEGLWSIAVAIGCALEGARIIQDFTARTSVDIEKIVSALEGTVLWLRLEEAYPPFQEIPTRTPYDWSELEKISTNVFAGFAGEPLITVKTSLLNILKKRALADSMADNRMPYPSFKRLHDDGKWRIAVSPEKAHLAISDGIVKPPASIFFWRKKSALVAAIQETAATDRSAYRWLLARQIIEPQKVA